MAFLDELKKVIRPIDDDDDYDYIENDDEFDDDEKGGFSEEYDDEPKYEEPKKQPAGKSAASRAARDTKPTGYRPPERSGSRTQIVQKHPESFEEAAGIAEELLSRKAVLLDLENASRDDARRLVDFLSGVAYALGGRIKRFSAGAYILTPTNIELVGDATDEPETEGIYF